MLRNGRYLLILLIVLVALSACEDRGNESAKDVSTKVEKRTFSRKDTQKGWIELVTSDEISSQDELLCIYEAEESVEKLEVHVKELDSPSLTYIYIDGYIVKWNKEAANFLFKSN